MNAITRLFIPLFVMAVMVGCGPWPTGEVCDQRNRILFAGMLADTSGPQCTVHDFDDDGYAAGFDRDDRYDKYTDDPDGRYSGFVTECWDHNEDGHDQYEARSVDHDDFDWSCLGTYWADELDFLCIAWEEGEPDLFEDDNLERESEAYDEFCWH